jgi:hypothetical protein
MINWPYDKSQYSKDDYVLIPEGEYPVRIKEATEKISSTGKNMIVLTLNVVNEPQYGTLFYNMVFDSAYPGMVNQRLGRIYDSFGITEGNLDTYTWAGYQGVARVKHKEYQGKLRAEVESFAPREDGAGPKTAAKTKQQAPAKAEGWSFKESSPAPIDSDMIELDEEDADIPF